MEFYIGNQPFDGHVGLAIRTAMARVGDGQEISVSEASGVVVGYATKAGWRWTDCGRIAWEKEVPNVDAH